jgi:probable phosphoglycerate mutase
MTNRDADILRNDRARSDRRTVYIVRHGVTSWNEQGRIVGHEDLSLSDQGRDQARGAGRLLAPCRLHLALTSPLQRTRQTAEIALDRRGVEAEVEPRLIELALKGWEGKSRRELGDDPVWNLWLTVPHTIATPEGERLEDIRRRAGAALAEALERLPTGGGLAIFTHGGVARVLILHLLGMPMSAYQKLRCDCGSVSAIEVTPEGGLARVLALNLTDPLLALSGKQVG